LIVVTSSTWSADHGWLTLYERTGGDTWHKVSPKIPVMLGRRGLAWGIGLQDSEPEKHEGDRRSPAGIFELERIYGRAAASPNDHFPYRQLTDSMEGIDDPKSHYYNRLVDRSKIAICDWQHSEKVRPGNPMFEWCIAVKHNWEQRPGYGSCIYLHIWKGASS
jgi:D-alanyl-D-alanine dipeptidase